jgi:hypothetical protein
MRRYASKSFVFDTHTADTPTRTAARLIAAPRARAIRVAI